VSRLTDLLAEAKAKDPAFGAALEEEYRHLTSRRAFGLNFERHRPEAVELPGKVITRGDRVRVLPPRGSLERGDQALWVVKRISNEDGRAVAQLEEDNPSSDEPQRRAVDCEDLVVVARFKDRIFPGLVETGRVDRAAETTPAHTVLNGENFHALKALTYTHRGKVDAIYIDPPYNTGARDWKYNNDYVEETDAYRHSKWLAFMERRLELAKDLLSPDDSVLVVSIDEKEYLRLGLLLNQVFPDARIQMVTTIIKPEGTGRKNEFSRTNEFLFFVMIGACQLRPTEDSMVEAAVDEAEPTANPTPFEWRNLRRRERESVRGSRPSQFYGIFIERESGYIHSITEALADDVDVRTIQPPPGCFAVYPRNKAGKDMIWSITPDTFNRLLANKFIRYNGKIVQFLQEGTVAAIRRGDAEISGVDQYGGVVGHFRAGEKRVMPKTLWVKASHNAQASGSLMLRDLIGARAFPFPKSLYAVEDALRFFISHKPNAVVLDFFAGSGTTSHAVMRLNRQYGGARQCISVTNNEVSAEEQMALRASQLRPGDAGWEEWGISEYITKPRLAAAITGRTPEGVPCRGSYRFVDSFPMAEGFEANARFFTLTYESPLAVTHGLAFERIAPLLWLKAGAAGRQITVEPESGWELADTYGLLTDLDHAAAFTHAVAENPGIRVAYIVTNDDGRFQRVAQRLPEGVEAVRLYESYLTNFSVDLGE